MPAHRKLVEHFHEPGDLHAFTFSCYRRRALLTNDRWKRFPAENIDVANEQFQFQLIAFVFMPEHAHLLVLPQSDDPRIDRYLAAVKRPTSAAIKRDLSASASPLVQALTIQERPGKIAFRFWQEGPGYDRNLRSEKAILKAIDYFHENPVRRGLCERAVDWRWSSARWYQSNGAYADAMLPQLSKLPTDFAWRA